MEGKIICTCCGDQKQPSEYYYSASHFHKLNNKLHVCKECIWNQVGENVDNIELIKSTLRMIDKPFLSELWKASTEEAERTNGNVFKKYMKNCAMKQNRELTWGDSDSRSHIGIEEADQATKETPINESMNEGVSIEMRRRWGGGLNSDDYEYLETFYRDYSNTYATDTPVQINLYRNIAKVHLQAEKELSSQNIKVFKDLMELSSKLHNDGNIKPIQSTGANDDKGLSTYGLWIKTIENDEPCEFFENKKAYEDYDGFQTYIDKWFVRPFKNIFNISKDFNIRDDD